MSSSFGKKFFKPELDWESTRWGRLSQGIRELAVVLHRDVTVEQLAEHLGLSSAALSGWKLRDARPKKENLEALERVFMEAGLHRYSMRYLDYGPEGGTKSRPVRLRRGGGGNNAQDEKNA